LEKSSAERRFKLIKSSSVLVLSKRENSAMKMNKQTSSTLCRTHIRSRSPRWKASG